MFKNVASQKIQLFAFNTTTGAPVTGDAANITAYVSKDNGSVTVLGDTSASEMDATNAKGVYLFDLTQAETNADELTFTAKSSTVNVSVTPRFISTTPPNFTAQSIDSNGRVDVIKVAGSTQTAANIGELINRLATLLEAAPGSPNEFRFTADALARLQTVVGMVAGNLDAQLAAIQADTNDIQTRLPAALVSGRIDASVGAMAADVITSTALATSAVTEIQSGLSTLDAAGVRSAVGLSSANIDTQLSAIAGYIDTEVGAIYSRIGAPAGASIAADIAAVKSDSAAILVDTAEIGAAGAGLTAVASAANLATLTGYVDTEVAAIKAVTDKLDTTLIAAAGSPGEYQFTADALENAPTGSGGGGLDAAGVRAAIGMASANLDTQLSTIASYVDTEVAAILAAVDTEVGAIKAVTDKLDTTIIAAAGSPGEYQFTSDALELAPSGGGGGGGSSDWNSDERSAIRAILGIPASGTTPDDPSTGILDTIRDGVLAVKAKTDNLPSDPADASDIGSSFSTVNMTLSTIAAYIDTEVGAIKAKTDNLPASPAATGDIPSAASIADAVLDEALSGHTTSGTLGKAISDTDLRGSRTVVRGTVDSGASTTSIPTSAFSPGGASADQFKGRIVIFDNDTTTAALRGEATDITTSSNASTPTLTVTALSATPAAGDTFSIV